MHQRHQQAFSLVQHGCVSIQALMQLLYCPAKVACVQMWYCDFLCHVGTGSANLCSLLLASLISTSPPLWPTHASHAHQSLRPPSLFGMQFFIRRCGHHALDDTPCIGVPSSQISTPGECQLFGLVFCVWHVQGWQGQRGLMGGRWLLAAC